MVAGVGMLQGKGVPCCALSAGTAPAGAGKVRKARRAGAAGDSCPPRPSGSWALELFKLLFMLYFTHIHIYIYTHTSCHLIVGCWKGTAMYSGYCITLGAIWSEFLHFPHCLPHPSNYKFFPSLTICHQVSTQSLKQLAPNILLFHLSHQHPDLQVHTQLGSHPVFVSSPSIPQRLNICDLLRQWRIRI